MNRIRLNSKKTIFVLVTVLIVTIGTVSYTLSTLANANQKVTQDITNFARGSYDILIRPPHAQTILEKKLNLIEENYLGIGDGGITIEQWKKIKNNPQVEIAAPVASIGLFTARERSFMISRNPEDAKYYEVDYSTSDGVNTYSNKKKSFVYDLGSKFGDFKVYPSSKSVLNYYAGIDIASFAFPVSYHQVVAVDPKEEGKLTGYDLSPLSASSVYDPEAYEDGKYSIPIMSLSDASVPVTIKFSIDDLKNINSKEVKNWDQKFKNGNPFLTLEEDPKDYRKILDEYISKKRMHQEKVYELVPEVSHSPFKQMLLYIDENMKLKLATQEDTFMKGMGGAFSYHSQRVGYRLSPVVYEVKDKKTLLVKQTGVDKNYGAPIYRNMQQKEFYKLDKSGGRPLNNDNYLGFIENGTFSIKEKTKSLASAPLGIYGGEMPYLESNPSVKLHPSAVPGSFITTPAHGLVSIEYAKKIKGDAPIDAIRVKVAGITGYDKKAASIIRKLANVWKEEGFTVDIVAGASLQNRTVDVEGIGKVIQPFTTLGAADTVVSSWNAIQVALTVLYGLVALTFVGFTFFNLLADREKDELLLAKLGWSEKLIRRIRYKEWGWILGAPITLILSFFVLLGAWRNQWLPFILSIIVSAIYVSLFLLADRLKKDKSHQLKKQSKSVTTQNIWFYRYSLFTPCIQLFLLTVLTCFLPFFLIEHVERTTQTRLGSYVHGEIEGMFVLVIILLYVLGLTTVYQSLNRMWKKRESEIRLFQYLGWEAKAIRTYFLKEVVIWAGSSTAIGWITSLVILFAVVEVTPFTIWTGITGFFVILAVTLGGSIYSLYRIIVKGGGKIANRAS
ncbi:hypothetical protein H5P36_15080 [Bacillus sp. APMAM]|nr:hypothetical protein [Bacillus sp. APMAM]RTZ55181.1 hypothetical protein EKO25_14330 [Bacillus sp. SAJ1]